MPLHPSLNLSTLSCLSIFGDFVVGIAVVEPLHCVSYTCWYYWRIFIFCALACNKEVSYLLCRIDMNIG